MPPNLGGEDLEHSSCIQKEQPFQLLVLLVLSNCSHRQHSEFSLINSGQKIKADSILCWARFDFLSSLRRHFLESWIVLYFYSCLWY